MSDSSDDVYFSESSSEESSSEDGSSSAYSSSSLGGDEWDSYSDNDSENENTLTAALRGNLKQALITMIGTATSRFERRTHPTYAWKEQLEYDKAKNAYLKEIELEKTIIAQKVEAGKAKFECADVRKAQKKINKKQEKRFNQRFDHYEDQYDRVNVQQTMLGKLRMQQIDVEEKNEQKVKLDLEVAEKQRIVQQVS